jgi:hypothetical protein
MYSSTLSLTSPLDGGGFKNKQDESNKRSHDIILKYSVKFPCFLKYTKLYIYNRRQGG